MHGFTEDIACPHCDLGNVSFDGIVIDYPHMLFAACWPYEGEREDLPSAPDKLRELWVHPSLREEPGSRDAAFAMVKAGQAGDVDWQFQFTFRDDAFGDGGFVDHLGAGFAGDEPAGIVAYGFRSRRAASIDS